MNTVAVVGYDVLTPYGMGVEKLWHGLLRGRSAIQACDGSRRGMFRASNAAFVDIPARDATRSRIMHMLSALLSARPARAPADAALRVATTTGEIDRLEDMVLRGAVHEGGELTALLPEVSSLAGVCGPAAVVAAACASSTAALTYARIMISGGAATAVLVIALDSLSEFLVSGFSALMALDKENARPFDRDRAGLTLGEAAAFFLLMHRDRAAREGYPVLGWLRGGGMTNDANHMTGPSREGDGLARAIRRALEDGLTHPREIACVAAHGTGTRYNDAMEMKALKSVFDRPCPTFSIKGGTGHTMGSAGALQAAVTLEALQKGVIPPTVGIRNIDDEAGGWVTGGPQNVHGEIGLVVNAGFGGINAAVVLERETRRQ